MKVISWKATQQERIERVEKVCKKYKHLKSQPLDSERYTYSPDYNLMFCANAKVGTTTYVMTTFEQIYEANYLKQAEYPEGDILSVQ